MDYSLFWVSVVCQKEEARMKVGERGRGRGIGRGREHERVRYALSQHLLYFLALVVA